MGVKMTGFSSSMRGQHAKCVKITHGRAAGCPRAKLTVCLTTQMEVHHEPGYENDEFRCIDLPDSGGYWPELGTQRAPKPHVHNSGWVQSPGLDLLTKPERYDELEPYVKGVLEKFRNDPRILAWDLFNEPDNTNGSSYSRYEPSNKAEFAYKLLTKTFAWARQVNPTQPLTAGVWAGEWADEKKISPINRLMLENSDVITFHNYEPLPQMRARVESLRKYNRPLLCTEYMARPAGSTFKEVMPYLKDQKVGAINWGFVAGKTQTIYPWDSWQKTYTAEPPYWFHDIFRKDGSAYDTKEVMLIRKLTGKTSAKVSPAFRAIEQGHAGVFPANDLPNASAAPVLSTP